MAVARLAPLPSAAQMPAARVSAVLDLDRTLVPGSSLAVFGRMLSDAGLVRRRDIIRHSTREALFAARGLNATTLERLCRQLLAEATGHDRDEVAAVAGAAARVAASRMFPAARWLVEQHLGRGDRVIVLSAAPQELVEAFAASVGAEVGLGTVAEVEGGRYTGQLSGPFCHGTGKVQRLADVLDAESLERCTAYGDSISDVPVLEVVAQPVAVNPDRALAAVAESGRWPVLRFH